MRSMPAPDVELVVVLGATLSFGPGGYLHLCLKQALLATQNVTSWQQAGCPAQAAGTPAFATGSHHC